jgi:hypothetical protein
MKGTQVFLDGRHYAWEWKMESPEALDTNGLLEDGMTQRLCIYMIQKAW